MAFHGAGQCHERRQCVVQKAGVLKQRVSIKECVCVGLSREESVFRGVGYAKTQRLVS